MKRVSNLLAWGALAIVAALCILNWHTLMVPAPLDLVLWQVQAPLGAVLLAAVLLACGLVLDTVTRGRIEAKRLAYLAIPATRGRQRAHREAERGALAVQAGEGVR